MIMALLADHLCGLEPSRATVFSFANEATSGEHLPPRFARPVRDPKPKMPTN
jgi:hypothetical protein